MIFVPNSFNIFDIIFFGSTNRIVCDDCLLSQIKNDQKISSILKLKDYICLFQLFDEYDYDAERLNKYKKIEENAKNFIQYYSMYDCKNTTSNLESELNKKYNCLCSLCAYITANQTVLSSKDRHIEENNNFKSILFSLSTLPVNLNNLNIHYLNRYKSCFTTILFSNLYSSSYWKKKYKNNKIRRSSVTFGKKELYDNFVKAVQIFFIKENDSNDKKQFDSFEKENIFKKILSSSHKKYIKLQKLEQRAKPLCPLSKYNKYIDLLNLQKNNKLLMNKNLLYSKSCHNIRSDSVDSGFSCASVSSYSSLDEDTATLTKSRDKSSNLGIDLESDIKLSDNTDFLVWLKSVKKILQLTKKLKNNSTTADENKFSIDVLDEIANQSIEVKNVN